MYRDFTHLTRPEIRTHGTCTVIFTHLTRPEIRTHGICTVNFTHLMYSRYMYPLNSGTYRIGWQQMLKRACIDSLEPRLLTYRKCECR